MALIFADRVKETSTITGTGTLTLLGAVLGFESFASAIGTTNTVHYCITDNIEWEVGLGTFTSTGSPATNTVSRDNVYSSSNNDALVNFSAGTKSVFVTNSAQNISSIDLKADKALTLNNQTGTSYTLVLTDDSKYVRMNNAAANTLTVPLNSTVAFPIGTQMHIRQVGAGQTTLAGAGSPAVVINSSETLKLNKQHSTATLIKVATDEWDLLGDLELA